jgi:hypothetical protein
MCERQNLSPEEYRKAWRNLIIIIVAIAVAMWLTSCRTVQYVHVPEYHNDTTYITKQQRDSIWLHDSIHVTERGDTIRIERWHTKYIEREIHDTLYRAKTDSIPVPYEVIKEVPAELSWWQTARIHLANILLYAILIFGIIKLGKWHLSKLKP